MKPRILSLLIVFAASLSHLWAQNSPSLNIGTKSAPFSYTNTIAASTASDPFFYYRFTLTSAMDITVSHCNSTVQGTGIFLLDSYGDYVEMGILPGNCSNPDLSYLSASNVQPGVYEVLVDWGGQWFGGYHH